MHVFGYSSEWVELTFHPSSSIKLIKKGLGEMKAIIIIALIGLTLTAYVP